jgi:hypothetical protein
MYYPWKCNELTYFSREININSINVSGERPVLFYDLYNVISEEFDQVWQKRTESWWTLC